MKILVSTFPKFLLLTLAATLGLAANFAFATWSNPPANPPANNAPAPINVSASAQTKAGDLMVRNLVLNNGNALISSAVPLLRFNDTNHMNYAVVVDGNSFSIRPDRNSDGASESPYALLFRSTPAGTGESATFADQVRANAYCDRNGNNCTTPADLGGGTCRWRTTNTAIDGKARTNAICAPGEKVQAGFCTTNYANTLMQHPVMRNGIGSDYFPTSAAGDEGWNCYRHSGGSDYMLAGAFCCS